MAADDAAAYLQLEDSVLEPEVEAQARSVLAAGGAPEAVVEALASRYVGLAEMCNGVAAWLAGAGVGGGEVADLVTDVLHGMVLQHFDPVRADAYFLSQSRLPPWLDDLVATPRRRRLLYDLAARHPACRMLSFAVRRVADQGHALELAGQFASFLDFPVFVRVLEACVPALLLRREGERPRLAEPPFFALCGHAEYTYFFSLLFLEALRARRGVPGLRALVHRMETAAPASEPVRRRMRYLASGMLAHPDVFDAVLAVVAADAPNPGDARKILDAYAAAAPPPLAHLRDPKFLQVLTRELFDPTVPHAGDGAALYQRVYALSWGGGGGGDGGDADDDGNDGDGTLRILERLYPVLKTNSVGIDLEMHADLLRDAVRKRRSLAYGVVYWVCANLATEERFHNEQCSPLYIELLELCVYHQRDLVLHVLDGLCAALEADLPLDLRDQNAGRRALLGPLVYVFQSGCYLPVLRKVVAWTRTWDPELVAAFVAAATAVAGPPYSAEYRAEMERLEAFCRKYTTSIG
jgi:hypothetical protein